MGMPHRAESCGCEKEIGMSKAHIPQTCKHGNLLVYVHGLTRQSSLATKEGPKRKRSSLKRGVKADRDWKDARAKVDEEQVCRVCGSNESIEAAHIIGRASDGPNGHRTSKPLWVNPDSIVPLCGSFSQMQCHSRYDAHTLDVLEFLTAEEQVQAVKDAGGIEAARMRTSPSSYRVLEGAA